MLNVKQAYIIVKDMVPNTHLISALNFGEYFGFLFSKKRNEIVFGASYLLVNRKTKEIALLPTTPNNAKKIDNAKKISLTSII